MPCNTYLSGHQKTYRKYRQHLSAPYMYVRYVHAVAGHDAHFTPQGVALDPDVRYKCPYEAAVGSSDGYR